VSGSCFSININCSTNVNFNINIKIKGNTNINNTTLTLTLCPHCMCLYDLHVYHKNSCHFPTQRQVIRLCTGYIVLCADRNLKFEYYSYLYESCFRKG
jgi:hypothetical protein